MPQTLTSEQAVIEAFKELFNKACFGSGIEGWVNDVNDVGTADELREDIEDAVKSYGRKDALTQIAFLMNHYKISIDDIEQKIKELKADGWPDYD
jgi:hypothetical protein